MNNELNIKQKNFYERIKRFQKIWKDNFLNEQINVVIIVNGKDDDEAIKIKVSAIYNWLFGFEFYESIIFITKNIVIIAANDKKIQQIGNIKNNQDNFLHLINIQNLKDDLVGIYDLIKQDLKGEQIKGGSLLKEKQLGQYIQELEKFNSEQGIEINKEIGPLIQESLCIKDEEELIEIKKAARVCLHFENKLIEEIEECIDSESYLTHLQISNKIEKLLSNQKEQQLLEKKFGLLAAMTDLSYMPIVQSGGIYDLRPQAESNNNKLSADVIICSVGGKYCEYNANLVRTLFINASNQQKQIYTLLLELHEFIIERLKANKLISKLYDEALSFIKTKENHIIQFKLSEKLMSNFGFGIGLEFRESNLIINQKNDNILKENMVFNICISANDLFDQTKNQKYAVMIADTVIVRKEEGESLTNNIARKFQDISYQIDDDSDDNLEQKQKQKQPQQNSNQKQSNQNVENNNRRYNTRQRNIVNNKNVNDNEQKEKERKEHQKQLLEQKQQELIQRLRNGEFKQGVMKNTQIKAENLKTYQNENEYQQMRKNQVHVDLKNNAVLIPIDGEFVIFNAAVIKNISKHEEGRFVSLRFNFHVQGGALVPINYPENKQQDGFIREITIRMTDFQRANDIIKKVKDIQKVIKQQQESKQADNEVEQNQEQIQLNKGKRPLMNDLKVRPNLTGKKISGSLEAHLNGFRYTTSNKSDYLDILYRNVKHGFFQPCDNEMIILIHLHLHRPIMVGKKKSNDIQFYTEAGIMTEDLDIRGRRNNYDVDEYEQEEREKQQRKKLNQDFEMFVKSVQQYTKDYFVFDIPYKQLGFYGTPQRSQVFLKPTVHCLVSLSETPFFVMSLDEIEVAYFERIQFGLRNFDLSFVFKDYDKPVVRISAIPVESLEAVKNWLNQMEILYSEGTLNLNWVMVMNQIKQDIEGFIEDGGWSAILFDEEEDESEQEIKEKDVQDEDSVFTVEENEEEVVEESGSEYSDEEDDDDFESDFDEEEELSEEGLDWDEMEEITKQKEENSKKNRVNKK